MKTRPLMPLLAAVAMIGGSAGASAPAPKDNSSSVAPLPLESRRRGTSHPYSRFGSGSVHSSTPLRYSIDPLYWNDHQRAAHAKSVNRLDRRERDESRRRAGIVRKQQLSAIRAARYRRLWEARQ